MFAPFKLKQFTIKQDKCAMKIGTDGILLGAWTSTKQEPNSILDVGTGTGVIALQLAQKTNASTIDAIEIEEAAYEQCTENFENSPWADRLFCYHASFQEFASELAQEEPQTTYDLIVSNPPFYSENYKSKNDSRSIARFNDALPFQHLLICVAHLLSENGIFSTIIPYKEKAAFLSLAATQGLFLKRCCLVKGREELPLKRVLLEFSFQKCEVITEALTLEIDRHKYTQAYTNLVKDFYLKM